MKSIIAAVVTCAVLFASSYAASNYFAQQAAAEAESSAAEAETEVTHMEEAVDQESTLAPMKSNVTKMPQMQVAHRPEKSVSLEAVLQMSDSIRKMEEKLQIRERKLQKEEQRVQLLFSDLETEQQQLQALSENVDAKVAALDRMTQNLSNLLASIESKKTEAAPTGSGTKNDGPIPQNDIDTKVNDVKGWFANLEPEQSSNYLKEFANNGKLEFAASLLHKMPDRQKSKILGALKDPVLVNQLIDALKVNRNK